MEESTAESQGLRFRGVEAIFLAVAVIAFLACTVPNLANFPPPTDDEIWILSASHKLATEGIFGTDLFKGFHRAEDVYLWNMPVHHLVLAAVFKVFGTSIFAGRMVSVVYGVATLLLTYLFARKVGGRPVAVLSVVLLLVLRLYVGFNTGLPLQEVAQSIRYDLAPVPFMLIGALILLKPTMLRAAIAGAIFSLAGLMQFYGAFMLPVLAVYLLLESGPLQRKLMMIGVAALAAIAVAIPYGVYVFTNYDEFQGQTSTLYRRTNLDDPELYIDNVKREYIRYRLHYDSLTQFLKRRPSEKATLFFAFPVSLIYLGWRTWRYNRRPDRLLLLSMLGVTLGLTFIEFQKVTYYTIAVFPFACVGIAATGWAAFDAVRRHWREPLRAGLLQVGAAGIAAVLLAGFTVEGVHAQIQGWRSMDNATDYMSLRPELAAYVPPGSRVLGSTQLWWAMPDTDYRSYYMLYYRTNPLTTDDVTSVGGYLDEFGAEYVALDFVSRLFLGPVNPSLNEYLNARADRIAMLPDKSFRFIEIWKIRR